MKLSAKYLLAATGCFILFVCIVQPWNLYFLNDDFMHISMDKGWMFLRGGFMRPVANMFLWLDKTLYGKNALGFFTTTIIMHVSTVWIVYLLVKEWLTQFVIYLPAKQTAFGTAMLFLFYPFHAESVMWIIARGSIIASFFTLLGFLFYLHSNKKLVYFIPAVLCFIAALFTYESMWNAVLVFAIISWQNVFTKKVQPKKELFKLFVMVLVFVLYLLLRVQVLQTLAGDGYLEVNENLENIPLLGVNLLKLVARIYTPPFENSAIAIACFVVFTLLFAILLYAVYKRNKHAAATIGVLWLLVVTGVLTASPLGINTHNNEADRYLYYGSFYFCFLIAVAITVLLKHKQAINAIIIVCAAFALHLMFLQKRYLFASAVARTTVETIQQNGSANHAYFIDVPTSYKGALIFRICLPNAIAWKLPNLHFEQLTIVSQTEFLHKHLPYTSSSISWKQLALAKGWNTLLPAINGNKLQHNDAVYWFTESSLYKVSIP